MTDSLYVVTCINELTREQETVEVWAEGERDAQHAACVQMFLQHDWRKTRALKPEIQETTQA